MDGVVAAIGWCSAVARPQLLVPPDVDLVREPRRWHAVLQEDVEDGLATAGVPAVIEGQGDRSRCRVTLSDHACRTRRLRVRARREKGDEQANGDDDRRDTTADPPGVSPRTRPAIEEWASSPAAGWPSVEPRSRPLRRTSVLGGGSYRKRATAATGRRRTTCRRPVANVRDPARASADARPNAPMAGGSGRVGRCHDGRPR